MAASGVGALDDSAGGGGVGVEGTWSEYAFTSEACG